MDVDDAFFPLCCRGLQIIGFPYKGLVYVCVHQLSIELWKAFDTPRVSVQRKIMDLGIKIIMGDKTMIRMLRASGVIENFRATMILLSDAEKLCDALDLSRKKRGLNKHALKSLYLPGARSTRAEEVTANKFTAKMKRLYNMVPHQSHKRPRLEPQDVIHEQDSAVDKCALSGNNPVDEATPSDYLFDLLLETNGLSPVEGQSCINVTPEMLSVENYSRLRPGSFQRQKGVASNRKSAPSTSDITSAHVQTTSKQKQPTRTPRSKLNKLTDAPVITPLIEIDSPQSFNTSTSAWDGDGDDLGPLSSPTMINEFEEACSASSVSSRTSNRSRHASGADTPERFLFFQNSSGSESDDDSDSDYAPPPHSSSGYSMTLRRTDNSQAVKPQGVSKRVIATKLRHFAKTTSPRVSNVRNSAQSLTNHSSNTTTGLNTQGLPSSLPNSAHGSQEGEKGDALVVKRKRGRPPKHPRATALSTFATKKRAMSRSPSPYSDQADECSVPKKTTQKVTNPRNEDWHSKTSSTTECNTHQHDRSSQFAHRPESYTDVVNDRRANLRQFTDPHSLRLNLDLINNKRNQSSLVSNSKEIFDSNSSLCTLMSNSTRNYDDDQISVTSSSTNSTNCSSQRTSSRLIRKNKSNLDERESAESQSLFRFNDLFSFFPPKLVVKDGELVPEHSLSVKKFDRASLSCLPEEHPFLKWSLGHPVTNQSQRTQSTCRNGRKRKAIS